MGTVVIGLRVVLAVVFGTAGVGKLLDRDGSRAALGGFGVPKRLQGSGAVALPLAELATAAALLVRPSARWGAVGGLVLLAAFIAAISLALAAGRAPECHCFGQIHSEPAGKGTLARNGALVALAVTVVVAGPGPSISGWLAARTPVELAATALAVVAVAASSFALGRWSRARARARIERPPGLPPGAPAPDFALEDLSGSVVTLNSLLALGRPAVLVFTHPGCGPCAQLLPQLARWAAGLAERLTIVAITQGGRDTNRSMQEQHGFEAVLLERASEVYDAYAMRATPSAVVVAEDGRIASVTAAGSGVIEEVIRQSLRRSRSRPSQELIGEPVIETR